MKNRLFIVIILLSVTAANCSKNVASENDSDTLKGTWELRSRIGGFGAIGEVNLPAGNGNIYSFSDSTYYYFENNVMRDSGNYVTTKGINPNTGDSSAVILFNSVYRVPYSIVKDTLTLNSGLIAADGTVQK